jgi:hypothetical protein
MFYSGPNPVIKRIQLELMSWWMTIVYRPRQMNIPPGYFSKIGMEFHFDPLLDQYRKIAEGNQAINPPTATGSNIIDENLPNFRGVRNTSPAARATKTCHLSMASYKTISNATLTIIPVSFCQAAPTKQSKSLNQSACGLAAFQLLQQHWILSNHTSQILRRLPLKYYTFYGILLYGIRTADLFNTAFIYTTNLPPPYLEDMAKRRLF